MSWKTVKELPPQGKKILCMDHGDFYVAQRFGKYWFSIPFYDSEFCYYKPPELWTDIDFPEPYKGYMKFIINCKELTTDELEIKYPEIYNELIKSQLQAFKKHKKGKMKNETKKT